MDQRGFGPAMGGGLRRLQQAHHFGEASVGCADGERRVRILPWELEQAPEWVLYRKWCEQNGWEADEGMEEEIQESREGKSERNEGGKAFTDACHWPARVIGFDTGKCCYIAICIAVL